MKTFTALKMTFFSLLLLIFTPAFALTPGHDDCADRTCGKHLIRYPFWIGAQQPSYCGYPPLNLTCINQTGTPVLTILGFEFYVNHIFYDNKSIQLTSSFYANNNPCALLFTNITGNVFPFTLSSSNKEIIFFCNCSSSKNLLSYQNMSCHGDSVHFGGEFNGWDRLSLPDKTCQLLRVPVAGNSPMTINGDYVALLKNGWLLNWTTPDCSECRRSGGRCRFDESAARFVCICRDRIHLKRCGFSGHHMSSKKIIIIVTAGLVVLVLCPCVLLVYYKISNEKEEEKIEALLNIEGSLFPKRYKYSEIKKMTKSFSEKLGQGGFGTVYKGTLKDGHLVAVKILRDSVGNAEEFINEVASVSRTSHVNIVNLLGFCLKGSKRALVCEFMPNGSLDKYIYAEKSKTLGYERLYGIAVGIAQGLEYLHCRCNTRIVHFDIKPHNILLDQDFCPKISDFGLAKLCTKKESVLSMAIPRGTIGYIAPEVYSSNFRVVSSKSDVYSYGMMVLEMFGMRRDFDAATTMSKSEIYFPNWIHDCLNTTNDDIIGIACLSSENKEITQKMITVSLWCIQMIPTSRPSMSRVLDMLEGSVDDLQMPPKQY